LHVHKDFGPLPHLHHLDEDRQDADQEQEDDGQGDQDFDQ
jgi:hypothetical protein